MPRTPVAAQNLNAEAVSAILTPRQAAVLRALPDEGWHLPGAITEDKCRGDYLARLSVLGLARRYKNCACARRPWCTCRVKAAYQRTPIGALVARVSAVGTPPKPKDLRGHRSVREAPYTKRDTPAQDDKSIADILNEALDENEGVS